MQRERDGSLLRGSSNGSNIGSREGLRSSAWTLRSSFEKPTVQKGSNPFDRRAAKKSIQKEVSLKEESTSPSIGLALAQATTGGFTGISGRQPCLRPIPEKVLEIERDTVDEKLKNILFSNAVRGVQLLYWLAMGTVMLASANLFVYTKFIDRRINSSALDADIHESAHSSWLKFVPYIHFLAVIGCCGAIFFATAKAVRDQWKGLFLAFAIYAMACSYWSLGTSAYRIWELTTKTGDLYSVISGLFFALTAIALFTMSYVAFTMQTVIRRKAFVENALDKFEGKWIFETMRASVQVGLSGIYNQDEVDDSMRGMRYLEDNKIFRQKAPSLVRLSKVSSDNDIYNEMPMRHNSKDSRNDHVFGL